VDLLSVLGQACDPRNKCETCVCDASGSGFKYTNIAGCCLSNANCTGACQVCNTNSATCQLTPGCCSPGAGITCSGACQACASINANGVGTCQGQAGCCTQDNQCTTTSKCIHCVGNACVRTDAPACCDSATDCTQTCFTCNSTNVCGRIQPLSSCCLANSDCGTDVCKICNAATHTCVSKPGCCNVNTDCGTSPCVQCTADHSCVRVDGCCESDDQCGACLQCGSAHTCVASADAACCVEDEDCGSCKRCAAGSGGAKTCLPITDCCLTSSDCEVCQNCTASQCVPVDSCCRFDADCQGCDVCTDYKCVRNYDLGCCFTSEDCTVARNILLQDNNSTGNANVTDCDLSCYIAPGAQTGQCQAVCTTPKDYTGLIVGLAVGIPLGLAALAALAAIVAFIFYRKRDALTKNFTRKDPNLGAGSQTNPLHVAAIPVVNSPL